MQFTHLKLENFRVFSADYTIDLKLRERVKKTIGGGVYSADFPPIVLFGGLNGAGKTSILTAIRLALLGRYSIGAAVSQKDYIEFLTSSIHRGRGKDAPEGRAKIDLGFEFTQDGKIHHYKIQRSWQAGNRDVLKILRDEEDMGFDYNEAQSYLLRIVPPGIADLFFFDGEKIAELAEDDTGNFLRDSVKRLLGLDQVSQLQEDLRVLMRRLQKEHATKDVRERVVQYERIKNEATAKKDALRQQADALYTQIEACIHQIEREELELDNRGGAWSESKDSYSKRQDELIGERREKEVEILSQYDGCYPLSLAPKTMQQLLERVDAEQASRVNAGLANSLLNHQEALVKQLEKIGSLVDSKAISEMSNYFRSLAGDKQDIKFDLSDGQIERLKYQVEVLAPTSKSSVVSAKQRLAHINSQIVALDDSISRAPELEAIKAQVDRIRTLDAEKTELVESYRDLLKQSREQAQAAATATSRLMELNKMRHATGDNELIFERSEKASEVLKDFAKSLTETRVQQLEHEFEVAYKKLARKDDLEFTARIDSTTFNVDLINDQGIVVNRKSLSAGEKQIFAISMLEALGKVSGRKLPVVIDTPLGRLDSKHRQKLVEHYFHEAAEQVLILSTDTEVDESFFKVLEDDISHAFEIEFDGHTGASSIREGYFWKNNDSVEAS